MNKTSDLQKLYNELGRNQVKYYYYKYKQYFKSISMDEKDVIQEIYLLLLELQKTYKEADENSFNKIARSAIKYKLCNFIDSAITSSLRLSSEAVKQDIQKLLNQKIITAKEAAVAEDLFLHPLKRNEILDKHKLSKKEFVDILKILRVHFAMRNNFMRIVRWNPSNNTNDSNDMDTDTYDAQSYIDDTISMEPDWMSNLNIEDILALIKPRLSKSHYDIFYSKFVEGLTNDEIKQQYNISRERVRQILERVRNIFSKKLLTKTGLNV